MVGLKNDDEKKNKEGAKEQNKKNDEVVTSEKVEEKVVSEWEKKKSNEQTTNKGKAIVNHPPIEHLPYPQALSKKDKERQYKHFIDIVGFLSKGMMENDKGLKDAGVKCRSDLIRTSFLE